MKFSVTTFATKGIISAEELMPKLQTFGYDGIELWCGSLPGGEGHQTWFRQDTARIADVWPGDKPTEEELARLTNLKALADRHELAIPMISPYFDFTGGQQRWEESVAVGRRCIQFASVLGATLIRTTGGRLASAKMTEAHWESCISGLRALTELPGADQVVFALECHPGRPEDTSESILREVNEVGANNLKILFQPSSFIKQASPREILDALYDHAVHIHTGLQNKEVEWEWMLPEMERRGYQGFLCIEGAEEPKLEYFQKTIKWLKEVIKA